MARMRTDRREHGEDKPAAEFERGPHRGRMLRDGDFALEITIFEEGVPPEFHVYAFANDKPLPASDVKLAIELGRLGNRVDRIDIHAGKRLS